MIFHGPIYTRSDLLTFKRKPEYFEKISVTAKTLTTEFESFRRQVASSAKSDILWHWLPKFSPFILSLLRIKCARSSIQRKNNDVDKGQPCLTPLLISNHPQVKPLLITVLEMFV